MTEEATPIKVESSAQTICPLCGETVNADAKFCEACGADLAVSDGAAAAPAGSGAAVAGGAEPGGSSLLADADDEGHPAACGNCGGTIAQDGYCERCGDRA